MISCSYLYHKPTLSLKETNMISFKIIKSSNNSSIGYIEEAEGRLTDDGVENKEGRKIYYIYNMDFNRIGFITYLGVFKYAEGGTIVSLSKGASYAIDSGVKMLLSNNGMIYYEDFEPTPAWHDRD
jgi:hypothetical protein